MSEKTGYDFSKVKEDFGDSPLLELLEILKGEDLFFHSLENGRDYVFRIQRFPIEDKPRAPAIIIKMKEGSNQESNTMLNINSLDSLYSSCMHLIYRAR